MGDVSVVAGRNGLRFGSDTDGGKVGLSVSPSGNVGVFGEKNPTHPLQLPGAAFRITADGAMYQTSTRSAKRDIKSLASNLAWELVSGLEAVTYKYKSSGEFHTGFIAEDVPEMLAQLLPPEQRQGLSELDLVAALCGVVKRHMELGKDMNAELAMLSQMILNSKVAAQAHAFDLDSQHKQSLEIASLATNLTSLVTSMKDVLLSENAQGRIVQLRAKIAEQTALQSELKESIDRLRQQLLSLRGRSSRRTKLYAQLQEQAAKQEAAIAMLKAKLRRLQ